MTKVFSLFNYQNQTIDFAPFIVFATEKSSDLEALSPAIMQVHPQLYIADMTLMSHYFNQAAQRLQISTQELIEKILTQDLHSSLSMSCRHPMEGLIFLNHFKTLGVEGHFQSQALFAKKSYTNISFHSWIKTAIEVEQLCEKNGIYKKERKNFTTQLNRFKTLLSRLQVYSFGELQSVQFYDIQRRYKAFFAILWKWTFPDHEDHSKKEPNLFSNSSYGQLDGFPWVSWKEKPPVQVHQHLEFPLSTWQQVEPELERNFAQLSQQKALNTPIKIMQFRWTLTLYDLSSYSIEVSFKHPICLQLEEENSFKTLRQQFSYGFQNFESSLEDKAKDLQFVNENLIIGWSIDVQKTIVPTATTLSLFSSLQDDKTKLDTIIEFENKIKGSIKVYQSKANHLFGLDFIEKEVSPAGCLDTSSLEQIPPSLTPIYIYPVPTLLESTLIKYKKFLERSSNNWWQQKDSLDSFRDYYICEDSHGQLIWAYKDYQNRWFKHGLFS